MPPKGVKRLTSVLPKQTKTPSAEATCRTTEQHIADGTYAALFDQIHRIVTEAATAAATHTATAGDADRRSALAAVVERETKIVAFRVCLEMVLKAGRSLGSDDSKMLNGGLLEMVTAYDCGLDPSTKIHGSDAFDEQKRGVEFKNTNVKLSDKDSKATVTYTRPTDGVSAANDTAANAAAIRKAWLAKAAGGHIWSVYEKGIAAQRYHLSGAFMAELCAQRYLKNPAEDKFVIGAKRCPGCHDYHRLRYMEEQATAWDADSGSIVWETLLKTNVKAKCASSPSLSQQPTNGNSAPVAAVDETFATLPTRIASLLSADAAAIGQRFIAVCQAQHLKRNEQATATIEPV